MDSNNQQNTSSPLKINKPHSRILATDDQGGCLDTLQLNQLEHAFRLWSQASPRKDVGLARQRILLLFLLIRYTGAKLNEVLAVNPFEDIDFKQQIISFKGMGADAAAPLRQVQISENLCREIETILADKKFRAFFKERFEVDPAFVRRKFYERAQACGFSKRLGGPEMIRRARAVEMMQGNVPLPAVQRMLGHSTPNLTSAYVAFSEDEIRQVTRLFMEKETLRKTSARNTFFGKITAIENGDIQAQISLTTLGGHTIVTTITNDSLHRLGLQTGRLITAEVKVPWVTLQKGEAEPQCSAENRFAGIITRLAQGKINSECAVTISDGTQVCALFSTAAIQRLDLRTGDHAWVFFSSNAVVLHVE